MQRTRSGGTGVGHRRDVRVVPRGDQAEDTWEVAGRVTGRAAAKVEREHGSSMVDGSMKVAHTRCVQR